MNDPKVRKAVLLRLAGELTEAEAAERAGIPPSRLRYYVRTSGAVAPSPIETANEPERSV